MSKELTPEAVQKLAILAVQHPEAFVEAACKTSHDCWDDGYREGYVDGLRAYAWWKDGVQYVGTCGRTLAEAIKDAMRPGGKAGKESPA